MHHKFPVLLRTLQGVAAATAAGAAADGAAAVAASAGPSADVAVAAEAEAEAAVAVVASDRAKDEEGSTADVVPGTADLPMASAEACPVFLICVALAFSATRTEAVAATPPVASERMHPSPLYCLAIDGGIVSRQKSCR